MKELSAIIEYENARRSVADATECIWKAAAVKCDSAIEIDFLSTSECIGRLYDHNSYVRVFEQCDGKIYEHEEYEQDMEPIGEAPTLCERCKILDEKIQFKKLCKKRFGIAKRRLSALARPHIIRAD